MSETIYLHNKNQSPYMVLSQRNIIITYIEHFHLKSMQRGIWNNKTGGRIITIYSPSDISVQEST